MRAVVALVLLAIVTVPAQQREPAVPATPAGKLLDAWLTAFNTGMPATILAFDAANRAQPMSINQTMVLRATTGGFTLIRVDRSEPHSISALVQDNFSERLERIDMLLDAATSKIVKQEVQPAARPADLAIPRLTESGAVAALVERASAAAAAEEFSGILLVARGDRVLLERGWGFANREAQTPVTLDTKFAIASTAKMIEAVAALQLVEAGRLQLDDAVGKHIPEYENREIASKVTVRHLLMHTGGTGGLPPLEERKTLRTPGDYARVLSSRAPLYEPGTEYQYSNYGFILLASLVERAGGLSFTEYAQRRIFEPAGMRSTIIGVPSRLEMGRAVGYSRQKGQWVRASSDDLSGTNEPFPVFSTARDLLLFARSLDAGTLISRAMLREATSPPAGSRYGYGLLVMDHGAIESYGHGGSGTGMNADVRIVPRLGYVVIGLSNFEPPAASRLVDFFLNRIPAE
jgi:CubicO group peptidase (beta-lactamase class C family)